MCEKKESEKFVGGRNGYQKSFLFKLLLIKKVMNWSMRTVSGMGGVSHSTLLRVNEYFLRKKVYEKYFEGLVGKGLKENQFKGTQCRLGQQFCAYVFKAR